MGLGQNVWKQLGPLRHLAAGSAGVCAQAGGTGQQSHVFWFFCVYHLNPELPSSFTPPPNLAGLLQCQWPPYCPSASSPGSHLQPDPTSTTSQLELTRRSLCKIQVSFHWCPCLPQPHREPVSITRLRNSHFWSRSVDSSTGSLKITLQGNSAPEQQT